MKGDIRFRETHNEKEYNPLTIASQTPFTQAFFYGEWQGRARRFIGESDAHPVIFFQTVEYALPLGRSYIYIPYGPVTVTARDEEFFRRTADFVRSEFWSTQNIFVRFDFSPTLSDSEMALAEKYFCAADPFSYHGSAYQPRIEWVLDLRRSEEEILAAMDKKNRYGIRVAEENKVEVRTIDIHLRAQFENFYMLMQETATRDRFRLHPRAYYERVFESCDAYTSGFLVETYYQDKLATSDLIVRYGDTATWVFGGSSTDAREASPSYLAQWSAIRHARELGCALYSFGGVSEPPYTHLSWEGTSRFKKRFGGRATIHSPFFDLVLNPFWYRIYMLQKRIRG